MTCEWDDGHFFAATDVFVWTMHQPQSEATRVFVFLNGALWALVSVAACSSVAGGWSASCSCCIASDAPSSTCKSCPGRDCPLGRRFLARLAVCAVKVKITVSCFFLFFVCLTFQNSRVGKDEPSTQLTAPPPDLIQVKVQASRDAVPHPSGFDFSDSFSDAY